MLVVLITGLAFCDRFVGCKGTTAISVRREVLNCCESGHRIRLIDWALWYIDAVWLRVGSYKPRGVFGATLRSESDSL
jgi:hypothetical protein